MAVQEEE